MSASARTSDGTAVITGSGSEWANSGGLGIGVGGTGALAVLSGGTLTSGTAIVGVGAGSVGAVAVDGAGSTWMSTGVWSIGGGGTGRLVISNGGAASTTELIYVGENTGGTGSVTVDGAGSALDIGKTVSVGYDGAGSLAVTNGGTVTITGVNMDSFIGYNASGNGVATIDGAGSSWTGSDNLFVGYDGTGSLVISNGGSVSSRNGEVGGATSGSGTGFASITGVGSVWNVSEDFYSGFSGSGETIVSNGGALTSNAGYIGYNGGVTGSVAVTGTGSSWANTGNVHVGETGTGTLTIANGGAVTANAIELGSNAAGAGGITVQGIGASLTTGYFNIGFHGTGDVSVTGGGAVSTSNVDVASAAGSSGSVTVSGPGSTLSASGNINVGVQDAGSLTIADGAAVSAATAVHVANAAGGVGAVNIGAAAGDPAAAAGTLNAPAVVFGAGAGTLNFNHTDANYLFSSDISSATAFATINQLAGVTKLSGNSSGFTGTTNVSGGSLYVNGTLGGTIDVTGGLFGGSGTVGAVTIASGGTFAPGNSIGTINVATATFNAGSVYSVEIDSGGASDLINATGTATINGGTVTVIPYPDYALGTTYTILTAAGGVTGAFDDAASTAFVTPTLTYDANNVYLELSQLSFTDVAMTPNQRAAAAGTELLGAGNALYDAVFALGTAAEAQAAFDAVSGEIHASARTALIEDSRFVRDAANERLRAAFGGDAGGGVPVLAYGEGGPGVISAEPAGPVFWAQAAGAAGRTGSDGNAATLGSSAGSFLFGADASAFDNWRFGVLGGVSRSNFDANDRGSSGAAMSYHLATYGGAQWGAIGLRLGAAYSWHDIDIDRTISIAGFNDSLSSSYGAGTAQAFGEIGYGLDARGIRYEPFLNLAYLRHATAGFAETGGGAALSGRAAEDGMTFATFGVRGHRELALPAGRDARISGMIGWRHGFGDTTPDETMAFAGGTPFTVAGVPLACDTLRLEAGIEIGLSPTATMSVSYAGGIGSGASEHSVKAEIGTRF